MTIPSGLLSEPPGSVVLVRMSSIGDTVHALPLLASLRRAWPDSRLFWVLQPVPYELMREHPEVERFFVFDRRRSVGAFPDLWRQVRGRRFDLVLDCHRYLKAGLVTAMLRAPIKLGFDRARARDLNWLFTTHRIPPGVRSHVQDQYFEFLDYLGIPVVKEWDFFLTEPEREAQRTFFEARDRPVLAVSLSSSRPEKNWILKRYARVLDMADFDLDLQPVFVGNASRVERMAARRVADLMRGRPVFALGDDLRRLVWLVEGSAVVLSPDTASLHIAAALNTPVVGLYGVTDPRRTGPYGRFADLVVDRYPRAGAKGLRGGSRRGDMAKITVNDVAEKLELAVRRYVEPRRAARGPA
ncbi:MAG: glycosyltransferase family 9 protein [Gemmatimonadota bacterium]